MESRGVRPLSWGFAMSEQPYEVRVIEGNDPFMLFEAEFDNANYEAMLPQSLNQNADRCYCGAQALHAMVLRSSEGNPVMMPWCTHHGRNVYRQGLALAHRDYRTPYDQWEKERAEAIAKALKELESKKQDMSNLDSGTSTPLHLAQWDRREGFDLWK